ncbi:hypothetical protein GEMRC1_014066 [Eukaryota sp. GEM-RC1]
MYLGNLLQDSFTSVNQMQNTNVPAELVEKWDEPKESVQKVSQIRWVTLDEAVVNDRAFDELLLNNSGFLCSKCLTHTISLLLKNFTDLPWIFDLV